MATSSEVRNKSREIDDGIRIQRQRAVQAKADFTTIIDNWIRRIRQVYGPFGLIVLLQEV